MSTCMITGHRPNKLSFKYDESDPRCAELKRRLKDLILEQISEGATHFLTGMALGVDTYAAEIILSLRDESFPFITLEAVIPCKQQSNGWSRMDYFNYIITLKHCDKITLIQENYTRDCMLKRNRYMVDHSDSVIAVWACTTGGTAYTVDYARKKGLRLVIMHPDTYSVAHSYKR